MFRNTPLCLSQFSWDEDIFCLVFSLTPRCDMDFFLNFTVSFKAHINKYTSWMKLYFNIRRSLLFELSLPTILISCDETRKNMFYSKRKMQREAIMCFLQQKMKVLKLTFQRQNVISSLRSTVRTVSCIFHCFYYSLLLQFFLLLLLVIVVNVK